jgi:hypothetical protein
MQKRPYKPSGGSSSTRNDNTRPHTPKWQGEEVSLERESEKPAGGAKPRSVGETRAAGIDESHTDETSQGVGSELRDGVEAHRMLEFTLGSSHSLRD